MRILLIEDDRDLASNVVDFLAPQHTVTHIDDGVRGLAAAAAGTHDVIVLDLALPRLDGLELCRSLRREAHCRTPVLVLTARDTLDDKVEAFEAGADDYLVKPFALLELSIRLAALVRRAGPSAGPNAVTPPASPTPTAEPELRAFDLSLDPNTLRAMRGQRTLTLTRIGLRILDMLLRASPGVVRREQLLATLWPDYPIGDGVLRTHIHALRKQVDGDGCRPLLHTLHGIGYRLALEP
jgi:DNA-binding response OmpR family regulator